MSEATAFPRQAEPVADTARVQPRDGRSQGPQITPVQPPVHKPPPDPFDVEAELAKPLEELPKFETHHTFTLARPITSLVNGQLIREVRLRAPNGLDLFEVGGPPTITTWGPTGMVVEMNAPRLRAWLMRLAEGIDMPTLYRASARDLRSMYDWLNGELNPVGN